MGIFLRLAFNNATGMINHIVLRARVPPLPPDFKIVDMRLKLYQQFDTLMAGDLVKDGILHTLDKPFSERDVTWANCAFNTAWPGGGGANGNAPYTLDQVVFTAGFVGWVTWQMGLYVSQFQPKEGDDIELTVRQLLNPVAIRQVDFNSTQDAANKPYIEIDVEGVGPQNLEGAPDPSDKRRPVLTWTPLAGVNISAQKVYRNTATGFIPSTAGSVLVGTLGPNETTITDTTIDGAGNDNTTFFYAVFTETAWNTGDNAFKSNEWNFIRPAVTDFYVTDDGGNEGVNIDVMERVHCHVTGTGGVQSKYYIDWSDSGTAGDGLGTKWFNPGETPYHWYTTTGTKNVRAKAINSLGFEGNLYAKTGAHQDPGPQALIPIATLEIAPCRVKPWEKITLDAYKSYARQSDGSISNYTYTAAGSQGLAAQPQASARAEIYYKTTGVKNLQVVAQDNGARNSAAVADTVTVAAENTVKLESLTGTHFAVIGQSKEQSVDSSPLIGEDAGVVVRTGGANRVIKIQGACSGTAAETNARVIEAWADSGKIVDVPEYDATGVLDTVYRGVLQNLAWEKRGGEEDARYWNAELVVYVRLKKYTEDIVFAAGIGNSTHYPIADYDGDGDLVDDVAVTGKTVIDIDYVGNDPDANLSEITLSVGFNGSASTTYWYEERK